MNRWVRLGAVALCVNAAWNAETAENALPAQPLPTERPATKFSSGQDVVPYFEGWIRNPDGTFDLVFGYFNRNWKEELAIAPGPNNRIEPNGPDAGQPTCFLPRRQRWIFRVKVPAN